MDQACDAGDLGVTQTAAARHRAAELFDAHFDAVYRYCLSRTADVSAAEDAAAQTFYEAARRLASDPAEEIDRRWLFVAAKRRVIDGWRRRERQHQLLGRVRALRVVDGGSPGQQASEPDSERVVAALASLSERQRHALVLRHIDELSVAEVADELDVTYQAAESLLARGRRSFTRAWRESRNG